jgi:hypothetical protein
MELPEQHLQIPVLASRHLHCCSFIKHFKNQHLSSNKLPILLYRPCFSPGLEENVLLLSITIIAHLKDMDKLFSS